MKRIIHSLLATLLVLTLFSACTTQTIPKDNESSATNAPTENTAPTTRKLNIVATTFPQYDWAREILGDKLENVDLTLLIDDGIDLHSFQPTVEDIAKISTCDMFIYVGGESDGWVHGALESVTNKDMIIVNLLDVMGDKAKDEEIVEGMQEETEHGHDESESKEIYDRPLSDWLGNWATIETALENGDLDDNVTHNAEENGIDFNAEKADYAKRLKSAYPTFEITNASVNFGNVSSNYKYSGYKVVESDHGQTVWYGFEAEDVQTKVPKFIAFTDHETGGEHEEEVEHADEPQHFHMRYNDESFEALVAMENWGPTFFPAGTSGTIIAEVLGEHSKESELDEHVWLSLKNAQALSSYIAKELEKLDPQNATVYAANLETYKAKLAKMDSEYQNVADIAKTKTLLFGDRFPFRYLVDDYNLEYFAAFVGCSAETEASFETIVFLSDKTNELNLQNVLVIENSDQSIAKTIVQNTTAKNQEIIVLDSMQSVTTKDISSGTTYLSIAESNLEALKKALN